MRASDAFPVTAVPRTAAEPPTNTATPVAVATAMHATTVRPLIFLLSRREGTASARGLQGRARRPALYALLRQAVGLEEGLGHRSRRLLVDGDRLVHRDHRRVRQLRADRVHGA